MTSTVADPTSGTGNAMLLRYTTGGALDTTFDTDGVVETNIATGTTDTWVGIGHTWDGKVVVSGYANGDFAAGRYFSGVGLNQRLYVQQDANWSVTSVSNPDGETVERYRYTPYGQRTVLNDDFTVNANPTTSDYGFNVGHQGLTHDGETGLIYNRARYLHNSLGRFTADDPLGTAYQDGMNLYEYVRGNPLTFIDPSGLWCGECQPPAPGSPNEYGKRAIMLVTTPGANPDTIAAGHAIIGNTSTIDQITGAANVVGAGTKGITNAAGTAIEEGAEESGDLSDAAGGVMQNLANAQQTNRGYALWVKIEFRSCDPSTSSNPFTYTQCQKYKWVRHHRWVQITSGSQGGQGVYGGVQGYPTPTTANIASDIKDALK